MGNLEYLAQQTHKDLACETVRLTIYDTSIARRQSRDRRRSGEVVSDKPEVDKHKPV
jgi:hypothetical protein